MNKIARVVAAVALAFTVVAAPAASQAAPDTSVQQRSLFCSIWPKSFFCR